MDNLHGLTANLTDRIRREQLMGEEHLVAPLVMINPGVLAGSRGPLYYPPEQVARNLHQWDNVPITLGHPKDMTGQPIGARTTAALNRFAIGRVLNTHLDQQGRLAAEAWISVARLRALNPAVLSGVENSGTFEISTGLFLDQEPAPDGATHNGKPYSYVAVNYRPDHLAILLDETGACSRQDGCGLNVNAQTKAEDGKQYPAGDYAYAPDPNKPSTWKLRLTSTPGGPPDAAIVGAAVAALGKGFRGNKVSIPSSDLAGVKAKVRAAWLKANPKKSKEDLPSVVRNSEDQLMDKNKTITYITSNSCCWGEEHKELLDGFEEDALQRIHDQVQAEQRAAVFNQATEFTDSEGKRFTLNDERQWVEQPKPEEPKPKEESTPVENQDQQPAKPRTADEWLAEAPAEIQSAVRNAMQIEDAERARLIGLLTANQDDAGRTRLAERLKTKSLDELRDLLLLAPKPEQPKPSYLGAAAPTGNAQPKADRGQYLPLPNPSFATATK